MLTPPARRRHDPENPLDAPSVRVLLVDDDENYRTWLTQLMRRFGFVVETATVNDAFGHLTGDRDLRDLGALFQARTRASDMIARYGGDEFLLLVVDLPLDDLTGAADRLAGEIESMRWTVGNVR